mmetsp:Transcript_37684/g.82567  ORF Transcript_37684/g.82567 Transcript_37684/m.82567 type:complete len:90 (-) Transcript_37684:474-743(-)
MYTGTIVHDVRHFQSTASKSSFGIAIPAEGNGAGRASSSRLPRTTSSSRLSLLPSSHPSSSLRKYCTHSSMLALTSSLSSDMSATFSIT